MANNSLQFSAALSDINEEEAAWLKAELRGPIFEFEDDDDAENQRQKCIAWAKEHGIEMDEDPIDFFECHWPGFDWSIDNGDLWIHDDGEYGNVENAANIVQGFLKKFKRQDIFVLEWAETCSKPRIGEFGGGGVVVTAKKIKWFSPSKMISEYTKKLADKRSA
jgi:hypothetical protein